jgi:hypothetical protein
MRAARHLSRKRAADADYQGAFPHAYHIDAELFADHLAAIGREPGIRTCATTGCSCEAKIEVTCIGWRETLCCG